MTCTGPPIERDTVAAYGLGFQDALRWVMFCPGPFQRLALQTDAHDGNPVGEAPIPRFAVQAATNFANYGHGPGLTDLRIRRLVELRPI